MIDIKNKEFGWVTDIFGVLDIYKHILVSKYDLPIVLHSYDTNRFFEELFDSISNTNQWDNFKSIRDKKLLLSLDELQKIIHSKFQWHQIYRDFPTAEDACAWNFLCSSRYTAFHIIAPLFTFKYSLEDDFTTKLFNVLRQLSKLLTIYSILYQRKIYNISIAFFSELLETLFNKSSSDLLILINSEIGNVEKHHLENVLNGDITYNATLKNIICRLSAMLDELAGNYASTDRNISNILFDTPFDIEHIQSYHDRNGDKRNDIWNDWGDDMNSIGNLMILEQDKNRSISNNPYEIKTKVYLTSIYGIVKNQATNYSEWTLETCRARKSTEVNKILNYLFN